MAQTKPKAAQFYGVSNNGTAGQVLISDGNGGMSWGANTEQFTVSWVTPTGQSLTYTQPSPQSSSGALGATFPTTTFTATQSGKTISGTATIAGLPTGITAAQSFSGSGVGNVLTVTLSGAFPGADSLNTALTISGLTVAAPFIVDYLVIAGGGGSSWGGGGAGGYRNSFNNEPSGGGGSSESALSLSLSTNYTVTVGASGTAGVGNSSKGSDGSNSVFSTITSIGGGGGDYNNSTGRSGGSGGGSSNSGGNGGAGTANQGYAGANADGGSARAGSGGGGASQAGFATVNTAGGNGGNGLSSSITGTAVTRAGGGGGGNRDGSTSGSGGTGGGGNASTSASANNNTAGTTNTGGGGGGSSYDNAGSWNASRAGGSGIVILRYPNNYTISGLSGNTSTVGTDKVTTFTNTGTGNIQFNTP